MGKLYIRTLPLRSCLLALRRLNTVNPKAGERGFLKEVNANKVWLIGQGGVRNSLPQVGTKHEILT